MNTFKVNFQNRLMVLAKDVIFLTSKLPKTVEYQVINKQLIRSVTSVGANYSASCKARSTADFIHKLHIVEEECDESIYWMKLLKTLGEMDNTKHVMVLNEMNEVLSVIIATLKTVRTKMKET